MAHTTTCFSVSFFPLMNDTGTRNAAVLCRATPRGETVDDRQCCNDGELASLRYHGGWIRLYVAATGPRNSWIAVVETGGVAGGRICSHVTQRGERFRWRGGREIHVGETEGLFRPRTEHRRARHVD